MDKPWRGVFPIVVTPFTKSYELDEKGLRSLVGFCLRAGVQGVVGPANASEFSTLSDDERKRWLEIVVAETGGQVPVIARQRRQRRRPRRAQTRPPDLLPADQFADLLVRHLRVGDDRRLR